MAGHSKWHNIQAKKGKEDAKRGKIFTKLGKELAVASKTGGSDPESNPRLKDAIAKAKANNMPQDTITRAIKRGAGELEGVNYEEIVYEGYGPNGVAIIVNTLTDNKNRTAGNMRYIFDRNNGNMGSNGCVSFMFDRKGQIVIERKEDMDEDEIMLQALEAGAEDFISEDDVFEIITSVEDFTSVREELEKMGYEFLFAELSMIPENYVSLNEEESQSVQKLIDKFEEDDDVQNVYHNAEFPEDFKG